jgi:hypothetical protein
MQFLYNLQSPLGPDTTPVVALRILPPAVVGRRSFHLALLLDTSGSMDGGRMSALKRTLHLLIDALDNGDKLSLVLYNGTASVSANSVELTDDRSSLHTIVDGMIADGGTNMEAALTALNRLTHTVDSVFILTDGMINQGVTSSRGLQRILSAATVRGTPVNTLGYGADHNARLLRDMSIHSRGTYTYADSDEMLPAIIGDITGGLATEYARNAEIHVPDGWTCRELGADRTFMVGTLIGEKEQWVVLEGPKGVDTLPPFRLTWNSGEAIADRSSTITTTHVHEQECRVWVAAAFATVTDELERGDVENAKRILTELSSRLDASPAATTPAVVRLHAQVDDMLSSLTVTVAPGPAVAWPGLGLAPAGAGLPTFDGGLAPVLSRLASHTATHVNQRGVDGNYNSPAQRAATGTLTAQFSQTHP